MGDWGRAGGFAIALIYFDAFDSRLFGGQSLGNRAVGIKVVTATGLPLYTAASTLRAAIFCVPYFLNGASLGVGVTNVWISTVLIFLVFGVGFSIGYEADRR